MNTLTTLPRALALHEARPARSAEVNRTERRIAGVRTPLLCAGDARATEAVVFVHGNPGAGEDWRALVGGAGSFARALAPDMPGYGGADKPRGFDYTVEGYARHLGALLDDQRVERAHLVLHDFGGPWALTWAAAHPHRVASVTLVNTGVLLGYRWHYLAKIWRTPLVGDVFQATATRPAFKGLLGHGNPRGLPADFLDRLYDDYDWGTRRAVLKLYRATGRPDLAAEELHRALAPLHLPALVLWGQNDPYIPAAQAELQRQTFAVERVVVLDDSGHWPFADNPVIVAAHVLPFLRRQVAREARTFQCPQAAA
ncbi:MAG: alpha/beta hydrolase [Rubrivivax sp.]|nr:alpha/beta hydrolase [Rubrivivax sp.]